MSIQPIIEPSCTDCSKTPAIANIIDGRLRDLGGFSVRRLLPAATQPSVGPFVFFDHAGPTTLAPGAGIDIRPHPHIGLCTVSYLFDGAILHRDSLGAEQIIRPGDLALMSAGRGIVHSERTPPKLRGSSIPMHALQLWIALPQAEEEREPSFHHQPADTLPMITQGDAQLRVLIGQVYGAQSPVPTFTPTFYVDAWLPAGSELPLPNNYQERAAYVISGTVRIGNEHAEPGRLLIFTPEMALQLHAQNDARIMLFGGDPLDGPRHLFWNFVSSSPARIEQAKRDWKERRFPLVPGDEQEFTPLPE